MARSSAPTPVSTGRRTIQFYVSHGTCQADIELAARLTGGLIFRGEKGAGRAHKLRATGWDGRMWLDPADYERAHSRVDHLPLWGGDPWTVEQRILGVVEPLSPGTYVHALDRIGLNAALDRESAWVSSAGGGRVSLALHGRWLTSDLAWLVRRVAGQAIPLSLAFADSNDPLSRRGAVAGLVRLLDVVDNVMVVRSDIGALGALAHGAFATAVGTGTSVRHVVPPERSAGGGRTGMPSVFVKQLMDWKLPVVLARLPRKLIPRCDLRCCRGQPLDRFGFAAPVSDARVHNLISIAAAAQDLLSTPPNLRAQAFRVTCRGAVHEAARLELRGGAPFEISSQVAAWAQL